ncbi:MAG: type VI secretion system tip protein TssI/VgrG [Polyangiaceae bacterium]
MSEDTTKAQLDIRLESRSFDPATVRVLGVVGREAVSQLFRFDIDLVSTDRSGLSPALAGTTLTLVIDVDGREARRVHGMVSEITDAFTDRAGLRHHRLTLVPHAYRLAMVHTQDIYMDITVPELLAAKLGGVGLARHVDMRLLADYPRRDFIVQWDETDLAFVSRLAEHLGIGFFFEEQGGAQKLVFTDHPDGYSSPEDRTAPFGERSEGHGVFEFDATTRMIPSFYAVRDYNDRTPHVDLSTFHRWDDAHPGGVVDFGSHVLTPEDSAHLARVRAEERRATQLVHAGKSVLPALSAGARFRFEGHPDFDAADLLITEVSHRVEQTAKGAWADAPLSYENSFRAIPAERTYRPPRATPRPRISGVVTAIVDPGPTGIERYAQMDPEGRYWLRFLFDTTPSGRRPPSLPVRMLQPHAGEGYGVHFPLKPGTEVLVAFVNGDPDRPVLAGAVHNPLTPPTVTQKNPMTHRIRTSGGVIFDIVDEP